MLLLLIPGSSGLSFLTTLFWFRASRLLYCLRDGTGCLIPYNMVVPSPGLCALAQQRLLKRAIHLLRAVRWRGVLADMFTIS